MMTQTEFLNLVSRFANRPLPALNGRHIYLWHGQLNRLEAAIPPGLSTTRINLHHLVSTLPRTPRAHDEARRLLARTIQQNLPERLISNNQQIYIITGCDLLSRYQLSLQSFFQLASETQMVILVVPLSETQFQPVVPLPGYVELDAAAPFEYLQTALGSRATITMDED
jgi:hypothetical protein